MGRIDLLLGFLVELGRAAGNLDLGRLGDDDLTWRAASILDFGIGVSRLLMVSERGAYTGVGGRDEDQNL